MIKNYAKQTVTWETVGNSGYGDSYTSPTPVTNCYIEKSLILNRGSDDTTNASAMLILFDETAFNLGDRITFPDGNKYIITSIDKFYKPRSTSFDHQEVFLGEINNG